MLERCTHIIMNLFRGKITVMEVLRALPWPVPSKQFENIYLMSNLLLYFFYE